jgi:hypothetical protein
VTDPVGALAEELMEKENFEAIDETPRENYREGIN